MRASSLPTAAPRLVALLLALAPMLAALPGCGSEDEGAVAGPAANSFAYQNNIFQKTWGIDPGASGPSSTPAFSWQATQHGHVVCALFDERMSVKDNVITNTHRLVWMWHSGLKGGREGNVQWKDGVADPQTGTKAAALKAGTYYWAVWSVDSLGIPKASSAEIKHEVK